MPRHFFQGVGPHDLTTMLFHLLDLPPHTEIGDRRNEPLPISRGRVLAELIG